MGNFSAQLQRKSSHSGLDFDITVYLKALPRKGDHVVVPGKEHIIRGYKVVGVSHKMYTDKPSDIIITVEYAD